MTSHTTTFKQSKDQRKAQTIKQQDNVITPFDPTTLTQSLPLLPFQNQVGGHCSFFRFSKRAICKPMSHKERQFYEHLEQYHVPLLPFTSQYLGVVNVTYRSSNVQAMLPEVILADNQHLLANWKKVCLTSSNRQNKNQQQRKQQLKTKNKRNKIHRRSISNDNNNNNNKNYYLKGEEIDIVDDDMNITSTWSPTTFKEQVLREVFSPHALEERLRQVQDWQKGMNQNELLLKKKNLISPDTSQKPRLQSRSVLDFRQAMESSLPPPPISSSLSSSSLSNNIITSNGDDDYQHSLRLISSSYLTNENQHSLLNNNNENNKFIFSDDDDDFKNNNNSNNDNINNSTDSPEVTVHPRRPTIIETTTSAPQTPRMRETRLHNPMIRPPIPSSNSPILQTSSSPLPDSPTSSISSSSISILPSPLPSQQDDQEENIINKIEEKKIKKDGLDDEDKEKDEFIKTKQQESASWRPRQAPNNPWSEQMYRRDLEKVNIDDVQQFILIEDLTDDIKYPCVLDLKMGTRQHGVYVTEAKMKSQTTKCEKSTSLKLGVRISGMQIYNFLKEQFIFEDKYKGRQLTPMTFKDTLVRYFDNGHGCQVDFLPTLIRKLILIFRIIESMDSYRFYASSLLIIYDANTSFNQLKNNNINASSSSSSSSVFKTTSTTNTNSNISSTSTSSTSSSSSPSLPTTTTKNKIDVRLIDFAKSISKQEWFTQKHLFTYPPTDITNYHKSKDKDQEEDNYGPDPGYLLGVQTLIKCFLWIYTNHGGKKEILSDLNDAISSIQSSPFWSKNDIDAL